MAVYIANVNGDWWEYDSRQPLYILNTEELSQVQIDEINEEHYGFENDKFENVIMDYGTAVYLTEVIE